MYLFPKNPHSFPPLTSPIFTSTFSTRLFAVHDADGLVAAGDREHRQHGAEDLLRHQRAVLRAKLLRGGARYRGTVEVKTMAKTIQNPWVSGKHPMFFSAFCETHGFFMLFFLKMCPSVRLTAVKMNAYMYKR